MVIKHFAHFLLVSTFLTLWRMCSLKEQSFQSYWLADPTLVTCPSEPLIIFDEYPAQFVSHVQLGWENYWNYQIILSFCWEAINILLVLLVISQQLQLLTWKPLPLPWLLILHFPWISALQASSSTSHNCACTECIARPWTWQACTKTQTVTLFNSGFSLKPQELKKVIIIVCAYSNITNYQGCYHSQDGGGAQMTPPPSLILWWWLRSN